MAFEDDFPSLIDKLTVIADESDVIINIFDLRDNCLDKQKVKDALYNHLYTKPEIYEDICKELGL